MSRPGYIKDYRKELDSDIWLMPPLYHRVWQWLKYSVNFTQGRQPNADGTITIIQPGQLPTSYRQIAAGVGYHEYGVWKEPGTKPIKNILDWLEIQEMIEITRNSKGTLITLLQWDEYQSDEENRNSKETVKKQSGNAEGILYKKDKKVKKDKNDNDIYSQAHHYKEIIDYLNQRTGRKFRVTDTYRKHMNARFKEGFTLEDFKIVIDKKCVEWMGTEWEQYLRPHTLFGTKFDGYLNQNMTNFKKKSSNPYADMVFDEEGNLIG